MFYRINPLETCQHLHTNTTCINTVSFDSELYVLAELVKKLEEKHEANTLLMKKWGVALSEILVSTGKQDVW